jgi:hypothetical protein
MLKRCCRRHAIPKWQGRSIRKNIKRGAAAAQISTEQDTPAADTPAAALRVMEQPDHFPGHFSDYSYYDDDGFLENEDSVVGHECTVDQSSIQR